MCALGVRGEMESKTELSTTLKGGLQMCRNNTFKIVATLVLAMQGFFVISATADPDSDPERCEAARHCDAESGGQCTSYRKWLKEDGIVCLGINSPTDPAQSTEGDRLATVQTTCDTDHGHSTFKAQVKCIETAVHQSPDFSRSTIINYIQLYTLTADNLVNEVARKTITPSAARVELQKALLEFRDRVDRQNAEASTKENAVRLQAQEAVAANAAERRREEERQVALQAADETRKREAQNRYEEAVTFCVAEATARMNANPSYVNQHLTVGVIPALLGAPPLNVNSQCENDTYWYKTIPLPQVQIHCSGSGGSVNCTEH